MLKRQSRHAGNMPEFNPKLVKAVRGKAAANRSKHGVSFDEAKTFSTIRCMLISSTPDHSHDEYRSHIFGADSASRAPIPAQ